MRVKTGQDIEFMSAQRYLSIYQQVTTPEKDAENYKEKLRIKAEKAMIQDGVWFGND